MPARLAELEAAAGPAYAVERVIGAGQVARVFGSGTKPGALDLAPHH